MSRQATWLLMCPRSRSTAALSGAAAGCSILEGHLENTAYGERIDIVVVPPVPGAGCRPRPEAAPTSSRGGLSGEHPERDLIARLEPMEWDTQESVSFEAACEAVNHVIGCYSGLIARAEERARVSDEKAIEAWDAQISTCIAEMRALRPTDHGAVARVRRDYSQRVTVLNALLVD